MPKKANEKLNEEKIVKATKKASVKSKNTDAKLDATKKAVKETRSVAKSTSKSKVSKTTVKESKTPKKSATSKAKKVKAPVQNTEMASTSQTPKTSKTPQTTQSVKTAKSPKSTKTAPKTKSSKTTKTSKTTKAIKTSKSEKTPKSTVAKSTSRTKKKEIIEYYDLPYSYKQTIVKILAQTPSKLFVYWDISEKDKQNFISQYGEDFFNETKPVLIIINETMDYSFEIDINDYANSWYISINDSDCKYKIVYGRRPISNEISISGNFAYISSSNELDAPNDHILFDKMGKSVFFKDVKSNVSIEKDISSISYIQNIGKIYNIYELYKELYKEELKNDAIDITLPTS